MLRLTYARKSDKFATVSVLGDAIGIRDLYWQLTHNYQAQDGTEIGSIRVLNLDGLDVTSELMNKPHGFDTWLSNNLT